VKVQEKEETLLRGFNTGNKTQTTMRVPEKNQQNLAKKGYQRGIKKTPDDHENSRE